MLVQLSKKYVLFFIFGFFGCLLFAPSLAMNTTGKDDPKGLPVVREKDIGKIEAICPTCNKACAIIEGEDDGEEEFFCPGCNGNIVDQGNNKTTDQESEFDDRTKKRSWGYPLRGFEFKGTVQLHVFRRMVKAVLLVGVNWFTERQFFVSQKVAAETQNKAQWKRRIRKLNFFNKRTAIELAEAMIFGLCMEKNKNRLKNCCQEVSIAFVQELIVSGIQSCVPKRMQKKAQDMCKEYHQLTYPAIKEIGQQGARLVVRVALDAGIYKATGKSAYSLMKKISPAQGSSS